jgi:SPFH domain / Band 7 family
MAAVSHSHRTRCTTPHTRGAVDGGERAVIFDRFRGILPEVVGEGTHLRMPWVQTPHIMDIRTRPRTISSVTGTKGAEPL